MYFNGEQYGDHTTPHARKLPWEKIPRHIILEKPRYNHDDMMPSTPSSSNNDYSPNPSLQSAMSGVNFNRSGVSQWGQGTGFFNDLDKLQREFTGPEKASPLTAAAIREEKLKHRQELKAGYARGESTVKTRLRAAAYTAGGTDYFKLFRFYDRDNSGHICQVRNFFSLKLVLNNSTRTSINVSRSIEVYNTLNTL